MAPINHPIAQAPIGNPGAAALIPPVVVEGPPVAVVNPLAVVEIVVAAAPMPPVIIEGPLAAVENPMPAANPPQGLSNAPVADGPTGQAVVAAPLLNALFGLPQLNAE